MAISGRFSRFFHSQNSNSEARLLVKKLAAAGKRLVTAESVTAGKIAAAVADIPGSSAALWGGFICYAAEAKIHVLGVKRETIEVSGVVSEETAREMAIGALNRSGSDLAVSVTGVAGPGRNAGDPPVGTVDMAICLKREDGSVETVSRRMIFSGNRKSIRNQTVKASLVWINDCLDRY